MKIVKGIAIAALVYVALVAAFESMIGTIQPQAGSTLVITTLGEDGSAHDRVVSRLESANQLYVAANHWPRAWYSRLLENPEVRVTIDGTTGDYQAVQVVAYEIRMVSEKSRVPVIKHVRGLCHLFIDEIINGIIINQHNALITGRSARFIGGMIGASICFHSYARV